MRQKLPSLVSRLILRVGQLDRRMRHVNRRLALLEARSVTGRRSSASAVGGKRAAALD